MSWQVTSSPDRFNEAVQWFADRFPVTDELLDQLGEYAGPRAWTIAGVAQLEVVNLVHSEILSAIEKGTTLEAFRKNVRDKLESAWGGRDPHRIETIFRNATQTAYNRGRWQQMQSDDIRRARPFLMFDAVLDSRTTKDICKPLDETVLSADDPFWQTHLPPLHHRCRSTLRTLRRAQAEDRGISEGAPQIDAADGFGAVEAEYRPDLSKYPGELADEFTRKQDAAREP